MISIELIWWFPTYILSIVTQWKLIAEQLVNKFTQLWVLHLVPCHLTPLHYHPQHFFINPPSMNFLFCLIFANVMLCSVLSVCVWVTEFWVVKTCFRVWTLWVIIWVNFAESQMEMWHISCLLKKFNFTLHFITLKEKIAVLSSRVLIPSY
jgi:hypothetical protein